MIKISIYKIKIATYICIIEHSLPPPLDLLVGVQILPGEIKLIRYVVKGKFIQIA
jgi:hypothetical protein